MTQTRRRWTRGHTSWAFGTALIFALGIIFGLIWGNVALGIILAAVIGIGWLIAYESWRGRNNTGVNDENHGIEL